MITLLGAYEEISVAHKWFPFIHGESTSGVKVGTFVLQPKMILKIMAMPVLIGWRWCSQWFHGRDGRDSLNTMCISVCLIFTLISLEGTYYYAFYAKEEKHRPVRLTLFHKEKQLQNSQETNKTMTSVVEFLSCSPLWGLRTYWICCTIQQQLPLHRLILWV